MYDMYTNIRVCINIFYGASRPNIYLPRPKVTQLSSKPEPAIKQSRNLDVANSCVTIKNSAIK